MIALGDPVSEGTPEPLGVTPTATGVNVAVVSSTVAAIDVCLFDAQDVEQRVRLPGRTGEVFHGHLRGVREGARYGLRAHGDFAPDRGLRFDPHKLLIDPFAARLERPLRLHPAFMAPPGQGVDSAPFLPKALVTAAAEPVPAPPQTPWAETVIYEAHVRGLTMSHPDIPEPIRGTFAALAHPAVIDHLKRLGVTSLELLPSAAWIDERHLPPLGLSNYWGYNPIAFCAPDPRLAPGGWPEIRAAVEALRAAGLETILDVVFNHTGEGDHLGPTLSLRGLDNRGYYWLRQDDPARYIDDTGTGATLRLDTARGVRLVTEALRAWVRRAGVAGFRFDLAAVLGRRASGFDPEAPLLAAILQDPELRELKLIAEPWDCGPGGYQLGRFPGSWGEWNDGFRDTVRRFWRGDAAPLGALAERLAGSQAAFAARGRPSRSINFVTAHDGFTLADLVSHAHKHNGANGEDNRDGSEENHAWNNGVEGPSDDPEVQARRAADQRALLAILLFARGTPMLAMGAELGHSQGGNNNAYAQDNATSWIDWAKADHRLADFSARLAQLRRRHPALRHDRFLTGEPTDSPFADVEWRRADGAAMQAADWDDPAGAALQMLLTAEDDRVAVLINRSPDDLAFRLPEPRDGQAWRLELDSGEPETASRDVADSVTLGGRAVALVTEAPSHRPPIGADDAAVAELALAAGMALDWWTLAGERHSVTPQTQRALLAAMGLPAQTHGELRDSVWRLQAGARRDLAPCQVVAAASPLVLPVGGVARWLTVEAEDGERRVWPVVDGEVRLPPLAPGRHRLRLGEAQGWLIVAPERAYEPPSLAGGERRFGVSAQLYALRRRGDQGVGDFTTLAQLCAFAASAGASLVAINPLHMLFPADRSRASPYHPSDRRFLDPLYLDVCALPGITASDQLTAHARGPAIDYPGVWALKARALEAAAAWIAASGWQRTARDAFVAAGGRALAEFCAFQILAEAHPGRTWREWPHELRDSQSHDVRAFVARHADRLAHHQILQWLCDRQLAEATNQAPELGLCRDLAVGAAPDGAEAWAHARNLALQVSIGAPPDAFAPQGQVWGAPPPNPHGWRAEGYGGFFELLSANMSHAGALRLDHVLGLARLFWVPAGADGVEGAYVRYPLHDLLGVLALESQRARCLVVGEDLGTVPEGLRDALEARGVYGYSVLPFEADGGRLRSPGAYRARALACVSTHDLPPLAGWWEAVDVEERIALGIIADADAARAARRGEKSELLRALAAAGVSGERWGIDSPFTPELAAAVHAFVAASRSQLLLVQAEDLAGERRSVNLPGTDRERPNWRTRAALTLEALADIETCRAILAAVVALRPPSAAATKV